MDYNASLQKFKMMGDIIVDRRTGTVSASDLHETAQLVGLPLQPALFHSRYAARYAAKNEAPEQPRLVNWRQFYSDITYDKVRDLDQYNMRYSQRLQARELAEEDARSSAKAASAAAVTAQRNAEAAEHQRILRQRGHSTVGDDQLRKAHEQIKTRMQNQFGDIRIAFRRFDKDASGSISSEEAEQVLAGLNLVRS